MVRYTWVVLKRHSELAKYSVESSSLTDIISEIGELDGSTIMLKLPKFCLCGCGKRYNSGRDVNNAQRC